MITLAPRVTQQDTNNAFTLLSLVTDGEKHKAKLDELLKHVEDANNKLIRAKEAEANAKFLQAKADATLEEAHKVQADSQLNAQNASEHYVAAQALRDDLEKREKSLKEADAAFKAVRQRLDVEAKVQAKATEDAMAKREATIKDAEAALKSKQEDFAKEHKAKIAQLNARIANHSNNEQALEDFRNKLIKQLDVLDGHMAEVQKAIKV